MLECMLAGRLDSISIVPNTGCFEECMDMLYKAIPSMPFLPLMSVHINLVEGLCLTDSGLGDRLTFHGDSYSCIRIYCLRQTKSDAGYGQRSKRR